MPEFPPTGTGTMVAGIKVGVLFATPGPLVVGDDGEPGASPGGFPDGAGLLPIGQTVVSEIIC